MRVTTFWDTAFRIPSAPRGWLILRLAPSLGDVTRDLPTYRDVTRDLPTYRDVTWDTTWGAVCVWDATTLAPESLHKMLLMFCTTR